MIMSAMSHSLTNVLVILTIIHKSSQEMNLVAAWWFTSTNGGTDLSTYAENDVHIDPLTYRIGPNGETDGAVAFRDIDIDGFLGGGRFDVVSITDKLVFTASMTFFCHVYIPSGSDKDTVFFAYKGSSLPALLVDLDTGSVQVENSCFDPITGNPYIDLTDLLKTKLDQWLQLAVVYDTTYGVKIYESGIFLAQAPCDVDFSSLQTGTQLIFGGKDEITQTMEGGALACAQFYNTALTQAEVQALACDVANVAPAPVHGGWGNWTDWTPCSVTCDNGTQTRNRECNNPEPEYGGDNCTGSYEEVIECLEEYCPVYGGWGNWTDWTSCSVTCDNGTQTRNRECNNPEPEYGGDNCTGSYEEVIECLEEYCPVDGSWGSWTEWAECPVDCGISTKTRSRVCNDSAPAYGGDSCPGSDSEREDCTTLFCISSISPLYGPEAGGTEISVRGSLADSNTVDIKLYIGKLMCSIKSHEQSVAVFTNPAYELHGDGATKDQPIMVTLGDAFTLTWNDDFTYMVDPAVSDVKPGKCNTRAQTIQTATGSNLDSVAHPKMVVGITGSLTTVSEEQITNCSVFNSTTMTCPCPPLSNIRSKRDTFVPVTAEVYTTTISFILDGITALEVADLTYYATVELGVFQSNYELSKDANVIIIKGTNLTDGAIIDDYTVKIGQYTCPDVQVTADEIQCILSDDIVDDLQGKSARVVVNVGDNIEFDVGLVEFPAADSPRISSTTLGAIIGGVISGLVLLALTIIFVALVKRSRRNQRMYLYNERNNYGVYPDPAQHKQPVRDVYHRERRSTNRRYRPRTKRFNRREYTQSRDPRHAHGRGHNTDSPYYSRGLAYTNSYRRNGPPDYDIYGSQDWAYY